MGAAAAAVFLKVPGAPDLRAAVVAVTTTGVGSLEHIPLAT